MEKIKKNGSKVVFLAVIALVCSWAMLSNAGSLNPSAPPGPTMKTLDEVEARIPVQSLSGSTSAIYVITQSGSYYLTSNINGVTDKHGIEIDANNVTIDLNGYSLIGPGKAAGSSGYGINGDNSVKIFNGSITSWRSDGIHLSNYARVTNVEVADCGGNGITVETGSTVTGCQSHDNTLSGINAAGEGCVVSACVSINNAGTYGIYAAFSGVISNCIATRNTQKGIVAGAGGVIISCSACYNEAFCGILGFYGCTISNCTAVGNTYDGIQASDSTINGCTSYSNSQNGVAASNCLIIGNTSRDNTNANWSLTTCTTPNNHPAPSP